MRFKKADRKEGDLVYVGEAFLVNPHKFAILPVNRVMLVLKAINPQRDLIEIGFTGIEYFIF